MVYAYGRNGALTYQKNLTTGFERSYTYMGSVILGWTETMNGVSKRFYAVTDTLGSVTQIRDADNNLVWDGEYAPFGVMTGAVGEKRFDGMFTGKDIDSETGLTYHWNRWRSEDGTSFISEDPARDGINWYGYALANPLKYTDPTGLEIAGLPSFWTMNQKGAYWANGETNIGGSKALMNLEGCAIAAMANVLTQMMSITHGIWSSVTPGMINANSQNFSKTELDSIAWNETASQYGAKATLYDMNPLGAIMNAQMAITSMYVIVQIPITVRGKIEMHYVGVNGGIQTTSDGELALAISATSENDTPGSRANDISSAKTHVVINGKLCVKLTAITQAIIVTRNTNNEQEGFTDNADALYSEIVDNMEQAIFTSNQSGSGQHGSEPDHPQPQPPYTINRGLVTFGGITVYNEPSTVP